MKTTPETDCIVSLGRQLKAVSMERDKLRADHDDCVKCLGDALQDTADVSTELATAQADLVRVRQELICALEREKNIVERAMEFRETLEALQRHDFELRNKSMEGFSPFTRSLINLALASDNADAAINQLKGGV